ncbi:MAG: hypothetical protein ACOVS5_08515 [Oligoflexus sp.]|jgi:hypothetical protein
MACLRPHFGAIACVFWLGLALLGSCKTEEKFPELGNRLTGPIDVASSPSGRYFYVLNSDYERRFNAGSLIVIDPELPTAESKVTVLPARRMGRTLTVGQNSLLVLYSAPENPNEGRIELWSLADEKVPALAQSWTIPCSPISGVVAPSRPYFAVSCLDGDIYMGTLAQGEASTLERVRDYGTEHRALYFYEASEQTWLLGFPSDSNTPDFEDLLSEDKKSYVAATDQVIEQSNAIPDLFEETAQARRRLAVTLPYQMFAYSVTEEERVSANQKAAEGGEFQKFRFVELGTFSNPTRANNELTYVYYTLRDASGQPATGEGTSDLFNRFYRTNFWAARPGLDGTQESFYLSQRGNRYGSSSNNILQVQINPSALARTLNERVKFEELFTVSRVYGFAQDRDNQARFPSDFEAITLGGEPMLLINHFRDLINFADAPFYSITRKFLLEPRSLERPSSRDASDFQTSYYQLAVSSSGKVLTCSFYGNALFLFDARPEVSIMDQTPTRIE